MEALEREREVKTSLQNLYTQWSLNYSCKVVIEVASEKQQFVAYVERLVG